MAYASAGFQVLAGLIGSYHIIYNDYLHTRILKESQRTHYNSMNVLSMHALIAAYSKNGEIWVDELKEVLKANIDYACKFINDNFDGVTVSKPEGTYMLFIDCTKYCQEHHISIDELQKLGVEHGVIWQDGRPFHGPCHIRMNLALPHVLVIEAFDRLNRYVFK